MSRKRAAIDAFKHYVDGGKSINLKSGMPNLPKSDAIAIIKFLLPKLAPKENVSSFNSGLKATKRLVEIASSTETTWEEEVNKVAYQNTE